jgi:hypothetical protein
MMALALGPGKFRGFMTFLLLYERIVKEGRVKVRPDASGALPFCFRFLDYSTTS